MKQPHLLGSKKLDAGHGRPGTCDNFFRTNLIPPSLWTHVIFYHLQPSPSRLLKKHCSKLYNKFGLIMTETST